MCVLKLKIYYNYFQFIKMYKRKTIYKKRRLRKYGVKKAKRYIKNKYKRRAKKFSKHVKNIIYKMSESKYI